MKHVTHMFKIKLKYLLTFVADIFAHSECFLFSITLSTQRPAVTHMHIRKVKVTL